MSNEESEKIPSEEQSAMPGSTSATTPQSPQATATTSSSSAQTAQPKKTQSLYNVVKNNINDLKGLVQNYPDSPQTIKLFGNMLEVGEGALARPYDLEKTGKDLKPDAQQFLVDLINYVNAQLSADGFNIENIQYSEKALQVVLDAFIKSPQFKKIEADYNAFFDWCARQEKPIDDEMKKQIIEGIKSGIVFHVGNALQTNNVPGQKVIKPKPIGYFILAISPFVVNPPNDVTTLKSQILGDIQQNHKFPVLETVFQANYYTGGKFANDEKVFVGEVISALNKLEKYPNFLLMEKVDQITVIDTFLINLNKGRPSTALENKKKIERAANDLKHKIINLSESKNLPIDENTYKNTGNIQSISPDTFGKINKMSVKLAISIDLKTKFDRIQNDLNYAYFSGGAKGLKSYKEKKLDVIIKSLANEIESEVEEQLGENASHYNTKEIALEILRREHIQYLSGLYPKGGIQKAFELTNRKDETITYKSSQVPEGEMRNCYLRWEPGLAAFRKHTFEKKSEKGNFETLIEYYHHSSPVVYEEPDLKKCIEGTAENFRQALQVAGNKPLTEIRLITPGQGFSSGENYQQTLKTYFAARLASTSQNPITLFFYGVNAFRAIGQPPLQRFINARATNELFEKAFYKLNIAQPPELAQIIKARQDLDIKIKALYADIEKSNLTEKQVEGQFLELLKAHHDNESKLLKAYRLAYKDKKATVDVSDPKKAAIKNDLDSFLKLKSKKSRHMRAKYNGQLQAILVRLNARLGDMVVTGCNDAKDRDGMVALIVEANEVYKDQFGEYPDITVGGLEGNIIRQRLKAILRGLYLNSTPAVVAEYVSWPGLAKGLDNTNQPLSGFSNLPNQEGELAGYFKKVYGAHGHPLPPEIYYTMSPSVELQEQKKTTVTATPASVKPVEKFINFHPALQSIHTHQDSKPGERKSDHTPIVAQVPLPTAFQTNGKNSLNIFSFNMMGEVIDDGAFNFADIPPLADRGADRGKVSEDYQSLQAGVQNVVQNKNTPIDFSVFQENTEKTKEYLVQHKDAPEHKDKKSDFSECQQQESFKFDENFNKDKKILPPKGKEGHAWMALAPAVDRYKVAGKDNCYIQIWNVHASFGHSPVEIEDAIRTLLEYSKNQQSDKENVLHIFVGDFNRPIGPTLLDKRQLNNIGTAIDHPKYQDDDNQGITFPDGCFHAYIEGAKKQEVIKIHQAAIESINLETGKPYEPEDLKIRLDQMPEAQQEKVKKLRAMMCLDESYKEQKIMNGQTILEYEKSLREKFQDNYIILRPARNQLNEFGVVMYVSKGLQNAISKIMAPDVIQTETLSDGANTYHQVGIRGDQIPKFVHRIKAYCLIEGIDIQSAGITQMRKDHLVNLFSKGDDVLIANLYVHYKSHYITTKDRNNPFCIALENALGALLKIHPDDIQEARQSRESLFYGLRSTVLGDPLANLIQKSIKKRHDVGDVLDKIKKTGTSLMKILPEEKLKDESKILETWEKHVDILLQQQDSKLMAMRELVENINKYLYHSSKASRKQQAKDVGNSIVELMGIYANAMQKNDKDRCEQILKAAIDRINDKYTNMIKKDKSSGFTKALETSLLKLLDINKNTDNASAEIQKKINETNKTNKTNKAEVLVQPPSVDTGLEKRKSSFSNKMGNS